MTGNTSARKLCSTLWLLKQFRFYLPSDPWTRNYASSLVLFQYIGNWNQNLRKHSPYLTRALNLWWRSLNSGQIHTGPTSEMGQDDICGHNFMKNCLFGQRQICCHLICHTIFIVSCKGLQWKYCTVASHWSSQRGLLHPDSTGTSPLHLVKCLSL